MPFRHSNVLLNVDRGEKGPSSKTQNFFSIWKEIVFKGNMLNTFYSKHSKISTWTNPKQRIWPSWTSRWQPDFPLSLIMLHWTWEQMTHQWVLCQTWWWLRQRQQSCQCWSYWQGRHCVHQSACSLVKMFRSKVWQQSLLMAKSFLATLWLKKSSTQQRTKEEKSSYCKNAEVSYCECAASFKIDSRYFVQQGIWEYFTLGKHWNSLKNRFSSYITSRLASAFW